MSKGRPAERLRTQSWNQATSDRLRDLSFHFSDEDGALSSAGFRRKWKEAWHF